MSRYVIAFAISLAFHGGLALLLATGLGASPSDQNETEQARLDLAHVDLSFAKEEDAMAAPATVEPAAAPPPRPAPQPQSLPPLQTKLVEPEGLVSVASIEEALKPPMAQEIPPPLDVPPPSAPDPVAEVPADEKVPLPSAAAEPAPHTAQVTAPPALVRKIKPVYPEIARRLNQEGTVVLEVVVATNGTVRTAEIVTSSGVQALDKAARTAVLKASFTPAQRGQRPVEGSVRLPIEFRLKDK